MANYYTSDWHLNHSNLVKTGFRDFETVESANKLILNNINKKVKKTDNLYFLGDFTMCNKSNMEYAIAFIDLIECDNIFICEGNHDSVKLLTRLLRHPKVKKVAPVMTVIDKAFHIEDRLFLSHYPISDFHGGYPIPVANLHGHSHGLKEWRSPFNIDVGVDCNNFEPMTWEELLSKHYGDHPNPRIGFNQHCQNFTRSYYEFIKENAFDR